MVQKKQHSKTIDLEIIPEGMQPSGSPSLHHLRTTFECYDPETPGYIGRLGQARGDNSEKAICSGKKARKQRTCIHSFKK